MSILERMEAGATHLELMAIALLQAAASGIVSIHDMEAGHPALSAAIAAGTARAEAAGIPLDAIEALILALARELAPAPPVA